MGYLVDARWANWAGGLPEANRTALLDEIFSPVHGLGLNIARYNIGGGGRGNSTLGAKFDDPPLSFRATPGFLDFPGAAYNWSHDLPQRAMLFGAKGRGVDILEAFIYSPPAWMTISGSVEGAFELNQGNVNSSEYQAYANYMTDVVKAYDDLWGIRFRTLCPVNEPVEGWWVIGDNQEGANFGASDLNHFLPIVQSALQARNLSTGMAGIDAWAIDTPRSFSKLSKSTIGMLAQINVHSYQPMKDQTYTKYLDFRAAMAQLGSRTGKKLYTSEWGPQFQTGDELAVALILSRTITLDINVMGVYAWSYWLAVEGDPSQPYWGLIKSDWTYTQPFSYVRRKQFYVMMQASGTIRLCTILTTQEGEHYSNFVCSRNARKA